MPDILTVLRYAVFGAFGLSVLAATGSWLVRTRRLSPFSALGRFARRASEPLIAPVERRLLRAGGNPVNAGWWLVMGVAVAGVLLLGIARWIVSATQSVGFAFAAGPAETVALVINVVYSVLVIALIVRVVGSWLGVFRYTSWMRPAYLLTDWMVEPLRRILPKFGPFDWSPLAALILLWGLKAFALAVI
ncbi:MAG TPA: YggT family protein [Gemmatimonadales bacterium]|nr:YggT family protein [Gemmatimonadales bacterium]